MFSSVVVIGAGVVGLACAIQLARNGQEVIVLEQGSRAGIGTSTRNSGVIHAGLYYPANSLKTTLCLRGRMLLAEYCKTRGIAHRFPGKLIVATTPEELPMLEQLQRHATAVGASPLCWLNRTQLRHLEPAIACEAALYSAGTGILDTSDLLSTMQREFADLGGQIIFQHEVIGIELTAHGQRLEIQNTYQLQPQTARLETRFCINAAGLYADRVAAMAGIPVDSLQLTLHWCKGSYFRLPPHLGRRLRHLVYPLPQGPGLGIHLTPDLQGQWRAGPDAAFIEHTENYSVPSHRRHAFCTALNRYLAMPITEEQLQPDYAGIRPRLAGPGTAFRDFEILNGANYGAPGSVHLLGIESPGLTACFALAEHVAQTLNI